MRLVCLLIIVVELGQAARAEEPVAAARAHLNAGIAYYDEGRYEEAAREMEAAYRLRPVADLQYDLAQCYERLARFSDAADAYRKYLSGAHSAPDRALVAARIANLEKRTAGQPMPSPGPERVVFKTIVVYREAPPPPGRAARWAAWGVGVLAAGGLASGIATAVLAAKAADQVKAGADPSMPSAFEGKPRDAERRGETMTIISGVTFGVAVVGVAGAVALYYLGKKIDREARQRMEAHLAPNGFRF